MSGWTLEDSYVTPPTFELYFAAVERVRQRLARATAALDDAHIPYAVIGGHAVAAWVADKDPAAVRTTRDVDVLVHRADTDRVIGVLETAGFLTHKVRSFLIFTDPDDPNRRNGVHVIFSGEKLWPSYSDETPDVSMAVRSGEGYMVLDLESLLRMKLTSFRDRDRTHIRDLLSVGAITADWANHLPEHLRVRFRELLASPESEDWRDD